MPSAKTHSKKSHGAREESRRWVARVTSDSTHPPPGLFTKKASTIASTLASEKVSPKGPASGLRMLIYFINRAGDGLSPARRRELEKAKALLSERVHKQAEKRKNEKKKKEMS